MIDRDREIEVDGKTYTALTFIKSFDKDVFQKLTEKIKLHKGFFIFNIKKWVIPSNNFDDLKLSLKKLIEELPDSEKEQEKVAEKFLSEYK